MRAKLQSTRAEPTLVTTEQKQRFADALKRVAGDVELLVSIASLVTEDAPAVFSKLKFQLAAGELSDAATTGHQLKGMLSTFETDGPVIMLQELIHSARGGDKKEAVGVLSSCEADIEELLTEIRELGEGA